MHWRRSVRFFWVLFAVGCAPAERQAVHYAGEEHAAQVAASALQSVERVPLGYEVFGRLETSCTVWRPGTPVRDRWLSDLDCSTHRLWDVLRDKAASVGAEVLVRSRCGRSSPPQRGNGGQAASGRLVCRAQVARPGESTRAQGALGARSKPPSSGLAASASEAARLDDPTADAAWRIRVSYRPIDTDDAGIERAPLSPSAVREVSDLPASHRELGTLVTDCDAGCSEAAMRASVRVAAGRLGASDVVGVRCLPQSPGWHCVGTLAKPMAAP